MRYFGKKQVAQSDEDTAAIERLMIIANRYRPEPDEDVRVDEPQLPLGEAPEAPQ